MWKIRPERTLDRDGGEAALRSPDPSPGSRDGRVRAHPEPWSHRNAGVWARHTTGQFAQAAATSRPTLLGLCKGEQAH